MLWLYACSLVQLKCRGESPWVNRVGDLRGRAFRLEKLLEFCPCYFNSFIMMSMNQFAQGSRLSYKDGPPSSLGVEAGGNPGVVVWGPNYDQVSTFWSWLESKGLDEVVSKVKAVRQLDFRCRFELVGKISGLQLADRLRAVSPQSWHVKVDNPARARGSVQVGRANNSVESLQCMTFNVATVAGKRQEIAKLLSAGRIDVFALQETRRQASGWRLRFPNYRVVETPAGFKGSRGLAVGVKCGLPFEKVGADHPNILWVKITVSVSLTLFVAGVYLTRGSSRVLRKLARQCTRYARQGEVLVMGDFNIRGEMLRRRVCWRETGMTLVPHEADAKTFHRRGRGTTAIDHIALSAGLLAQHQQCSGAATAVRVYSDVDISDHWPVVLKLETGMAGGEWCEPSKSVRPLLRVNAVQRELAASVLARHNYWDDLVSTQYSLDELAVKFEETSKRVYSDVRLQNDGDVGLAKPEKTLRNDRVDDFGQYKLSKEALAAIRERREAFKAVKTAAADEVDQKWSSYEDARRKCKEVLTVEKRQRWGDFVSKGCKHFVEKGPLAKREFYAWCRKVSGVGRTAQAALSVKSSSGEIIVGKEAVLARWAEHFGQLAGGEPLEEGLQPCADGKPDVAGLNDDFTWPEVVKTIKALKLMGRRRVMMQG